MQLKLRDWTKTNQIREVIKGILNHYIVVCLAIALFSVNMSGGRFFLPVLGIILCVAGFIKGAVKVDLWILLPLIFYNIFCMISSYVTHGNISENIVYAQGIFPVIYLLMAYLSDKDLKLLKRLCVLWAAAVAVMGLVTFTHSAAVDHIAVRLGGWMGNPNTLGIFLVIGYFAFIGSVPTAEEKAAHPLISFVFCCIEPLLLAALALTLSMGSFVALAVGTAAVIIAKLRRLCAKETFFDIARFLAKIVMGLGLGFLLYLTAARSDMPRLCVPVLAYIAAFCLFWTKFERFLEKYTFMTIVISISSLLLAIGLFVVRPSAAATFTERLEMMRNGVGYIKSNPLLGVGPGNWRELNMIDGDKYFNTNRIHNVFINAGAEFGIPAMLMLVVTTIRGFCKKKEYTCRAGCAALLFHSLMDTVFFIPKVTIMFIMTSCEPHSGGVKLNSAVTKVIFGLFAMVFAFNLYQFMV